MSLAIGVIIAFDMVLWPDPAERKLLRSLADTLDRQCQRLAAIGRAYVDPLGVRIASALPPFRSGRAAPVTRASQTRAQQSAARNCLARCSHDHRALHIEIERLLAIACDNSRGTSARRCAPDRSSAQAIGAALRAQAHKAATGLRLTNGSGPDRSRGHAYENLYTAIFAPRGIADA